MDFEIASKEDMKMTEEALKEYKEGKTIPLKEVKKQLGM